MAWLIIIFALMWLVEGIISFFWSTQSKKMMDTALKEIPVKSFGIMLGIMGLCILAGSRTCHIRMPVIIIGSVVFIKGIALIIISEQIVASFIQWWINTIPAWFYKIWGLCVFSAGILLLICR